MTIDLFCRNTKQFLTVPYGATLAEIIKQHNIEQEFTGTAAAHQYLLFACHAPDPGG